MGGAKIDVLRNYVGQNNFSAVFLTETYLTTDVQDSFFGLPDYSIFRKDRDLDASAKSKGGGVAILVKNSYKVSALDYHVKYRICEVCAVDIVGDRCDSNCRLICVYRPPSFSLPNTILLFELLSSLVKNCNAVLICGDFNFAGINWKNPTYYDFSSMEILLFLVSQGLAQLIDEPTHISGNTLDLLIVSDQFLVNQWSVSESLLSVDHYSIVFSLDILCDNTCASSTSFDFRHCTDLKVFLSHINWELIFENCDNSEKFWTEFKNVIKFGAENLLRKKTLPIAGRRNLFPLSRETKKALSEKKRSWILFKSFKCHFYKEVHRFWTKKVTKLISNDRANHEMLIAQDPNMNRFHKYVKQVLGRGSGNFPVVTDLAGNNHLDSLGKATAFNDYFCSVFVDDDNIVPPFPRRYHGDHPLESIDFSCASVMSALKSLSYSLSSGPDGFPPRLFKNLRDALVFPLSKLFTVFFELEVLPKDFTSAVVVPIFKGKGNLSNVENYRPISLTSVACKCMERCIKDEILLFLTRNNLINLDQHGFLPRRSTLTELLECFNDWIQSVQSRSITDVVYLDLRKAFDSVVHSKLLLKCWSYGIRGKVLSFIRAFLSNRLQSVRINGIFSNERPVLSGVPQGSVLGPLLFLIYINDLPDCVSSSIVKMYADDTKIYSSYARSLTFSVDLQGDLDSLESWFTTWQLTLNISKCSVLTLSPGFTDARPTYEVSGSLLNSVTCVRDLGILVSSRMDFSDHCNDLVSKASRKLGLIYRAFRSRDKKFMTKIYVTHVRPLLEYNSEIWSPFYCKDIDRIEGIQRSFLKRIRGFWFMSYADRLAETGLESLEFRRIVKDLVLVYKMRMNLVDIKFDDFFTYAGSEGGMVLRGNSLKLYPKFGRTNLILSSFPFRVVNIWNALSDQVVMAPSLNLFKKHLNLERQVIVGFLKGRAFRNP